MKHLIIYAHPNPKSFNNAILEVLSKTLKEKGHEVTVRDLYAMDFNPVLGVSDFELLNKNMVADDIKVEQAHVGWADVIIFIYPVWWNSMPAIARGYVDRVFSLGFAYSKDNKGLLPDKKVLAISTLGAPLDVYEKTGLVSSMQKTIDGSLADFCGMEFVEHKYFGSVPNVSDEDRKNMLEEVKQIAERIS